MTPTSVSTSPESNCSAGTYPIAAGTYIRPYTVDLEGYSPARGSTTHSLRYIGRSRGAHRWSATIHYGPMYRAEWEEIVAFLDEQNGPIGKFTIVLPGKETPRGAISGAPQVDADQAAGVTTVNLKNLALGTANILRRGDLLTFASHLKVYEVTRNAASDGAGKATVYINSPLMTAITNGSAVAYQNVSMQARLLNERVPRTWKGGLICPGFDVAMIEEPY